MLNGKKFFKGQNVIDSYDIGTKTFAEVTITSANWNWSGRFYKIPKTNNILINYGDIIPLNVAGFDITKPTNQFTTRSLIDLNITFNVTIVGTTTIKDSFIMSNSNRYDSKYTLSTNKTISRGQVCTFVIDSYPTTGFNENFFYYEDGVKKYFPKLQLMTTPSIYLINTDNIDSLRFNGVDVKVTNENNKYALYYLNELGGVDWISCNNASYKSTDVGNEYIELETLNGLVIKKEKRLSKQTITDTFNLKSVLMNRDEYNLQGQLFRSPKCYLNDGTEVFITTTSFSEKNSRSDKLVQLDLAVQTKQENITYGQFIY